MECVISLCSLLILVSSALNPMNGNQPECFGGKKKPSTHHFVYGYNKKRENAAAFRDWRIYWKYGFLRINRCDTERWQTLNALAGWRKHGHESKTWQRVKSVSQRLDRLTGWLPAQSTKAVKTLHNDTSVGVKWSKRRANVFTYKNKRDAGRSWSTRERDGGKDKTGVSKTFNKYKLVSLFTKKYTILIQMSDMLKTWAKS